MSRAKYTGWCIQKGRSASLPMNKTNLDLTGATLRLQVRDADTNELAFEASSSDVDPSSRIIIDDAPTAAIQPFFSHTDTDSLSLGKRYYFDIEIVYGTGSPQDYGISVEFQVEKSATELAP